MSRPSLIELRRWVEENVPDEPSDDLGGYKPREELQRIILFLGASRLREQADS